jgi:hypothetical protein
MFCVPFGNEAVVIAGGAAAMEMPSVFVATRELASVTCTVKVLVPVPVGFPEITPVLEANVNPAGKLPTVMDHV